MESYHSATRPKVVRVRAYSRFRNGRTELVSAHWRSLPRQLAFDFSGGGSNLTLPLAAQ